MLSVSIHHRAGAEVSALDRVFRPARRRTTKPPRPARTPRDGPDDNPPARAPAPASGETGGRSPSAVSRVDVVVGQRAVRARGRETILRRAVAPRRSSRAGARPPGCGSVCVGWPLSPRQSTAMPIRLAVRLCARQRAGAQQFRVVGVRHDCQHAFVAEVQFHVVTAA